MRLRSRDLPNKARQPAAKSHAKKTPKTSAGSGKKAAPSKETHGSNAKATKELRLHFFCNSKPQSMPKYFFYKTVEIGPDMDVYRDAIYEHVKQAPDWLKPVNYGGEWQIRYTVPD